MEIKLRNLVVCTLMIFILTMTNTVNAESSIKLWINGDYVESNVAPYIEDNSTLVPLRVVAEALTYNVDWNNETKQVIIKNDTNTITMNIGSKEASHNDKNIILNKEPKIVNSTTFLPIRDIAERFGNEVNWDSANKVVVIGKNYKSNKKVNKKFVSKNALHIREENTDDKIRFNLGEVVEVIDEINDPNFIVIKGDKRYKIPSEHLMSIDMSKTITNKIDILYDMELANKHLKGELPRADSDSMYFALSSLGAYRVDEVNFENIINEFLVKGNTNNDKIVDIIAHLEKYNLKYDFEKETGLNQLQRIPSGYTKCLGITKIGKALLDKSSVPYRVITTQSLNYISNTTVARNGGHILLQVKNNNNEWVNFDLTQIILENSSNSRNRIKHIQSELINPSNLFPKILYDGVKTMSFLISPEILNDEIAGDSIELFITN